MDIQLFIFFPFFFDILQRGVVFPIHWLQKTSYLLHSHKLTSRYAQLFQSQLQSIQTGCRILPIWRHTLGLNHHGYNKKLFSVYFLFFSTSFSIGCFLRAIYELKIMLEYWNGWVNQQTYRKWNQNTTGK